MGRHNGGWGRGVASQRKWGNHFDIFLQLGDSKSASPPHPVARRIWMSSCRPLDPVRREMGTFIGEGGGGSTLQGIWQNSLGK